MKIVVVGAGIVGVTSAYALLRSGHEVTVVDRHHAPALGASHANGGFLSPSHCAPWAAPGVPLLALKSMLAPESTIRIRPDFTWTQLSWMARMSRECTAERFQINRQRMLALGLYSKRCLEDVDRETNIRYERNRGGILQLAHSPASQAALQTQSIALGEAGVNAVWLDPKQVTRLEPAMCKRAGGLTGALHIPGEGAGRCEKFCADMTTLLERSGVRFVWGALVDQLAIQGAKDGRQQVFCGLRISGQTLEADACVVAAGVESRRLMAQFLHVPIYPVKGYSMTVSVSDSSGAPGCAVLDDRSRLAIAPFSDVIRVAGFAEVTGDNLRLDTTRCAQLVNGLEALFPMVADTRNAHFWTGQRPMTPDGTPIIGRTRIQGLYLNAGHGTYGWTLSFGSAQLLADIVAGTQPHLPAEDYAISRYER